MSIEQLKEELYEFDEQQEASEQQQASALKALETLSSEEAGRVIVDFIDDSEFFDAGYDSTPGSTTHDNFNLAIQIAIRMNAPRLREVLESWVSYDLKFFLNTPHPYEIAARGLVKLIGEDAYEILFKKLLRYGRTRFWCDHDFFTAILSIGPIIIQRFAEDLVTLTMGAITFDEFKPSLLSWLELLEDKHHINPWQFFSLDLEKIQADNPHIDTLRAAKEIVEAVSKHDRTSGIQLVIELADLTLGRSGVWDLSDSDDVEFVVWLQKLSISIDSNTWVTALKSPKLEIRRGAAAYLIHHPIPAAKQNLVDLVENDSDVPQAAIALARLQENAD